MKRAWSRWRLWDHPLLRRRFRGAPRSVSALTLVTALGLLCAGAILGRAAHYGAATPAVPPPPAPSRRATYYPYPVGPGAVIPGMIGPGPMGGAYSPALLGASPSRMPRTDFLEPLPAELMGRQFVRDLGMLIVVILFLIVPGSTGQIYARAKKQKTFDLLLLTPLRPASIVLGDWLGYALPLCSVSLVALPFFVLSIAYGGVSLFEVGGVFAVLFALTFALASVGLFCSTVGQSFGPASGMAYLLATPLAVSSFLGIELLITGSGNFLDLHSHFVSMETAVLLLAVLISASVALNSLWWAIADFEYLYYRKKGEPVPGQRERFLSEGL